MAKQQNITRNLALKQEMAAVKADTIREDGRLERHCEKHGVGHTVGHVRGFLYEDETIHGCSGGCAGWKRQEIRKRPNSQA